MRTYLLAGILLAAPAYGMGGEGTQVVGWRGDGTGRYPQADPPLTWERRCTSPVATLCFKARRPASAGVEDGRPLFGGFIPEWLLLGPIAAGAAEAPTDADEGEKSGDLAWKLHRQQAIEEIARRDRWAPWNPSNDVDFINLSKALGLGENQSAYALTRVFADRAGTVSILVNHAGGMKAWVNGAPAYSSAESFINLMVFSTTNRAVNAEIPFPAPAPRFDAVLRRGWNTLLFKVTASPSGCRFNLRITAPADARYETKNIRWTLPLPSWSNGSPIVVRDRVLVTSEPDELLCVNARDGKALWRRTHTFYDAVPADERARNPAYAQIEPLAARLPSAETEDQIWGLRRQIYDLMKKIDPKKYLLLGDHTPAHGWTTPTPVSDGSHVYVLYGHGVAACYDLDGHRKWIRLVNDIGSPAHFNVGSPALIEGRLVILRGFLRALDAKTGATVWTTGELTQERDMDHGGGRADNWPYSLNVVRLNGEAVVYLPGKIVRVSDGKVFLTRKTPGHWTTPVVVNNAVFDMPDGTLVRMHFRSASAGQVSLVDEQQVAGCGDLTFSSPLLHEGIAYGIDCKGVMAAFEAGESGPMKKLFSKDLEMRPVFHYNSNGVAASVALGGRFVFFFDDQGTCVVLEPGRTFKEVARNRIEEFMQRRYCVNPREISTRSSPAFDGTDVYVRGERNLYCIGKTR